MMSKESVDHWRRQNEIRVGEQTLCDSILVMLTD